MSRLAWDPVGRKIWETGVDQTVLFPMNNDGTHAAGVAWSGITAINESPSGAEPTKIYADNIVYGVLMSPEEDALTVEAFTYPPEFASCIGETEITPGAVIKQQDHAHFGLAYRTMIGNDTVGTAYGYKIHIFWDCVAGSSEDSNSTVNDSPEQKTWSWSVTSLPVNFGENYKPAASIVIDSTTLGKDKLTQIENLLYGTDPAEGQQGQGTASSLPTPAQILNILKAA